jgi:hypothetical protein
VSVVGVRGLRRARDAATDAELSAVAPYAFAATPTTVEFPGTQALTGEVWDRATTTVHIRGQGITRRLELTSPGKRTRTYLTRVLGVDAEQVVAMLEPLSSE